MPPVVILRQALVRIVQRSCRGSSSKSAIAMASAKGVAKTLPLRQLGSSALNVTDICLGTMTFGVQNTEEEGESVSQPPPARRSKAITEWERRWTMVACAGELLRPGTHHGLESQAEVVAGEVAEQYHRRSCCNRGFLPCVHQGPHASLRVPSHVALTLFYPIPITQQPNLHSYPPFVCICVFRSTRIQPTPSWTTPSRSAA